MTGEERNTRPGLVSVITIFLNAESFLEEAIRSVIHQTYGRWELLLVDDGSTDGSTRLAQEYAMRHPGRVRYLEHPDHRNRGMSASRNLGIRHAHGEFIALLDADDDWLPYKLERQVAVLEQNPEAAMVYGPTLLWHGWTGAADDAARDFVTRLPVRGDRIVAGERVLSRILRQRGSPVYTCSILARREAVLSVGGFEEEFRNLFEDQVFFSKFLLAHRVYVMRERLDRYRQHPDSSCGIVDDGLHASKAMRDARLRYLTWLASYVEGKPVALRLRWVLAYERWLERHPGMARLRGSVRSTSAAVYDHSVRLAFALGRRIIPRVLRRRLWNSFVTTPRRGGRAQDP